jgi:Phosphotransferase enzyme family
MTDRLTQPEDLTVERLAKLLRQRGLGDGGGPIAITERERRRHLFSLHVRFEVLYRDDPDRAAPSSLFLKLPLADSRASLRMVADEARFYRSFGDEPALPIVRWLAADDNLESPFLLLDDLSATHTTPSGPLPATRRQTEAMIDALARFHARWWEDPSLGFAIGERWSPATVSRTYRLVQDDYRKFADIVGERISGERRAVYEAALRVWPRLAERFVGLDRLTLIHGDAHAWNCLFPNDPDRHPAYLVDLSTCRIRTPANDLAYMMAVMWFPDLRRRWELPMLRRYHEHLVAAGVRGYPWDDLWWDYRFAVIINLFTPVHQAASGEIGPSTWWYNLERIHAAFEDLDCRALL